MQIYLSHPGMAGQPIRTLAGFERIHLAKGARQTVSFTLDERALSTVDEAGVRSVGPGKVDLWLGGGQPGAREGLQAAPGVSASVTLSGPARILPK